MSTSLLYRGNIRSESISKTILKLKKEFKFCEERIQFANWNPTQIKEELKNQMKINLNSLCFYNSLKSQPPAIPRTYDLQPSDPSVCAVSNRLDIVKTFKMLTKKFDLMYAKRAFVHW